VVAYRRLLLVTPEFEHPVRGILDGLDTGSLQLLDKEFEQHIIGPGVMKILDLPAGAVVIRDRDSMREFREMVKEMKIDPERFPPRYGEMRRQR